MSPATPRFNGETLRGFAAGLWGAAVGMYLTALVLAAFVAPLHARGTTFHPEITPFNGLEAAATLPWQEVLEKRMYFAHLAVCPALAWLAVRWSRRLSGWACLAACVLFAPAITSAYDHYYHGHVHANNLLFAAAALALPLVAAAARRFLGGAREAFTPFAAPEAPADGPRSPVRFLSRSLPPALALLGMLAFFYGPRDVETLADRFTTDFHVSSYVIGPALYYQSPSQVPALDFESHYGIGHAYTFSFLLGPSLHVTLCRYVWSLFAVTAFFYLSAYVVLGSLLRSLRGGFVAAALLATAGMECYSFACPSNWPVRMPLLFVFLAVASRAACFGRRWLPAVLAGLLAGLSLFWQTDVGLYLGAGGFGYFGVLAVRERLGWARPVLFLVAAGGTFAALCGLALGPRALTPIFYQRLVEPLLLYSTGFGFTLMRWRAGWSYLYNLVGPAVALATLGWAAQCVTAPDERARAEARFLFLAAAVGLLMLFKWVNRSMDILWWLNGVPVQVVLFWWARQATLTLGTALENRAGARPAWLAGRRLRTAVGAASLVAVLGLAGMATAFHTPADQAGMSSSPLRRMAHFVRHNPTVANAIFFGGTPDPPPPTSPPIDPADVAFLRNHTEAAQPVVVLSTREWVYLAEAGRAPGLPWVPVCLTHSHGLVERVEKRVRGAELLFVDRATQSSFRWWNAALCDCLQPILDREFTRVATGKDLDLYRRKTPGSL